MQNLQIEYKSPRDLNAYAGNAKVHSKQQVREIINSIRQFGFVNPILVDEANEVIAGHGRLMAASEMLMPLVPVVVLTGLSDEKKRALRLADNKIAEHGTWDMQQLAAELASLKVEDFDITGIGFSDSELDALLGDASAILPDQPITSPAPPVAQAAPTATDATTVDADEREPSERTAAPEPRPTDDNYSMFQLVMLHENKLKLLDVLNRIKAECEYEKQEDALMHIIREFEGD